MAAIRLLPEALVNRIAAGEVIERPAAAVKELVENALDAGATRIAVALDGGGIERIEVADDGCGMTAAELALAVQRHATSKLADDDRWCASPRSASAARRCPASAPRRGSRSPRARAARRTPAAIRVEGGQVGDGDARRRARPAPASWSRDLFFATPARRKFLKSPRTEAEHAEAAVRRLALAAPGVAFRLESDGRVRVRPAGAGPRRPRRRPARARRRPRRCCRWAASAAGCALAGFAAPPAVTRAPPRRRRCLVVNGRPVADPVLRTAVRVAYRDVIAPGGTRWWRCSSTCRPRRWT